MVLASHTGLFGIYTCRLTACSTLVADTTRVNRVEACKTNSCQLGMASVQRQARELLFSGPQIGPLILTKL